MTASAAVAFAFILLPLVFVSWLAFFQKPIPAFPPQGYSLKWFFTISENPKFVDGFWLSLQVAVIAMLFGLAIGVPAALCLARYRFRAARGARTACCFFPSWFPGSCSARRSTCSTLKPQS